MKKNQPSLHAQIKNPPWRQIPAAAPQRDRGHGREEHRTLKAATIAAGLCFPYAMQAFRVTRRIRPLPGGKWRTVTTYAVTSLTAGQATPAQLAGWIRGHWRIEALHHISATLPTAKTHPRPGPATDPRSWPRSYAGALGSGVPISCEAPPRLGWFAYGLILIIWPSPMPGGPSQRSSGDVVEM